MGLTRRLGLLQNLFGSKLENFILTQTLINHVLTINQQLEDINAFLDDNFVGNILLNGLPSSYNLLVMTLGKFRFTKTRVTQLKVNFSKSTYLRLKQDDKEQGKSALVTRNKFEKSRIYKCFRCHELGNFYKKYLQKDIPKKARSTQKQYYSSRYGCKYWFECLVLSRFV